MGEVKQINIKNRTYYFYNDIIYIKAFEPNLLKIDKKHYKATALDTSQLKKIDECETIFSVNALYLRINYTNGYIEEKNGNKYLIFYSVDENKEVLKKYADVWDGIKNKTKAIKKEKIKKMITKKIT